MEAQLGGRSLRRRRLLGSERPAEEKEGSKKRLAKIKSCVLATTAAVRGRGEDNLGTVKS
jgi:hypothetical protein